jgi:hypothetical protein
VNRCLATSAVSACVPSLVREREEQPWSREGTSTVKVADKTEICLELFASYEVPRLGVLLIGLAKA